MIRHRKFAARDQLLDDLDGVPRWVAWQREDRDGQPTKIPLDPNTGRRARVPTDPTTYGTRKQAKHRWQKIDDGHGGGVGIVLGDIEGTCVWGIDLDGCIDPQTEDFAPWAIDVLDRFDSYAEISPSGTGCKLFFLADAGWANLFGKNTKGEPKTRVAFTAGEHREIAIDRARFYAVTGKRIDGPKTLRPVSVDDVQWFINVAGPQFKGANHSPTDDKSSPSRDESGSGYGFRFMAERKAVGDSYESARAAILADTGLAGKWANRENERQLQRAWDNAGAEIYATEVIAKFDELAALDRVSYDRQRQDAHKALGIRLSTLDAIIEKRRARKQEAEEKKQQASFLAPVKPWDSEVDGAALLEDICDILDRHIILPDGACEAVALWIVHAHAHDAARHSPILFISSPTKRCGKTNLLSVLQLLTPKPLSAANVTPATVFRAIALWKPTLLIDESDTFIADKSDLRGVLNSGHTKTQAYVVRCAGDDLVPTQFSTWSPKAFAGIGRLHPTLEDRAIKVELRRKLKAERVERIPQKVDGYEELRRQCARFAADHAAALADAEPVVPKELSDRAADNWTPLLAIADAAGGNWPVWARAAAKRLSAVDDDESYAELILKDMRTIFDQEGADAVWSEDAVRALIDMESRPWAEYKAGKPLTVHGLARLLKNFKIFPRKIRLTTDGQKRSGYTRDRFEHAWRRYLDAAPAPQTGPSGQTRQHQALTAETDRATANPKRPGLMRA